MLFLLVFQALVVLVSAQVYVGFPFTEQLPNVARVNQPYSFTVADSTYRSTYAGNNINYYASDLPAWLSFDDSSRTFTGTPAESDVGNFQVSLSGYDTSDGTSMSNNYSMVVSSDQGLHLTSADVMFVQIAKYGQTNGDDGLVVKQGQNFSLQFDKSVFESYPNSTRPIIAYYGRSEDRSPLPPWISFDSDDLTFSGTVPYATSENAPSYEYGFGFIASDYYGFAGAEGVFKLIVGGHQLSTSLNETIKLNGTLGDAVTIDLPIFSDVYLDGSLISKQNISNVSADDLPSYLVLNTDNYTITGKYPTSETFDNFTVIVEDIYQNQVNLPYSVDALGSVFTVKSLPNVNATRGQYFSYQLLESYFTDTNNTQVSVDYSADWLTYHDDNKTFTGSTPSNFDKLSVNVTASSSFDKESKSFGIDGVDKSSTSSSSSSSSSTSSATSSSKPSSTSSSSSSAVPVNKSKSSNTKALAIGLGVGVPVFCILVGALLLFCCCAKRRKNKDDGETGAAGPAGAQSPEISGPGFGTTVDKDDHDENAQQLAALNVLNLDKSKGDYDDEDIRSTSSSITHVESLEEANYFDASEKPQKSWRAKDNSDVAMAARLPKRASEASLSTVNTEQLFSVRLVEDLSRRNSQQSSSLQSRQLLSNNSLNALLTRSNSGNIVRLDSDGNIVDTLNGTAGIVPAAEKPRLSRSASTNLDVLVEENSKEYTINSAGPDDSNTTYHSTKIAREDTDNSSFNLLAKFHESRHPSQANSHRDLSNYNIADDEEVDDSLLDEFKATKISDGEFKWEENVSAGNVTTSTVIVPRTNYHNDYISPSSEHFVFGSNEQTPTTLHNSPMKNANLSAISVGSATSDSMLRTQNANGSDLTLNNRPKAKLVEFTRKGSLRESAYEPDYQYQGQTAQMIHEDDFSD